MIIVGITGGIGSGKSLATRVLSSLGYPIYEADARAKALMQSDPDLMAGIKALFGEAAYDANGLLQRNYLSGLAFSNPELLQKLNALVHPATGKDFLAWAEGHRQADTSPLIFKEAAILFESGAHLTCDQVITVYAPKSVRLQRVMHRDQVDRAAVEARMDKQWSEMEKISRADYLLFNDGRHLLLPQIVSVLRDLTEAASAAA